MAAFQPERFPAGAAQQNLFKGQFSRTKVCRFHAMGQCRYGERCSFAHGSVNLAALPDLRKTSICKEWRHGTCPRRGADCPFAHGRNELRRTEAYAQRADGVLSSAPPGLSEPMHVEMVATQEVRELFELKRMIGKIGRQRSATGAGPALEELSSASTRSGGSMFSTPEPIKVATGELQCCGGPSATVSNVPCKYTQKMLKAEIKDMGFEIPRDIVYIHMPTDAGTQLNYGHCLIVFTGAAPLRAFVEVFQGRALRHFNAKQKGVTVTPCPTAEPDASPTPSAASDALDGAHAAWPPGGWD